MGRGATTQEKRWAKIWQEKKYKLLGAIKKETPTQARPHREGLSLEALANITELPPSEAVDFFEAMKDWGANVYVDNNHIFLYETLRVTKDTHEDLIPFSQVPVLGEAEPVMGVRFGLISDTHFGSRRRNPSVLKEAYRHFKEAGITHVIHAGNLLAGIIPKRYRAADLETTTLDGQVELLQRELPKEKGITTYFILGHTDITFEQRGIDPSRVILEARPDLNYLGAIETDLVFFPPDQRRFVVRVYNERQRYAVGKSYYPQKLLSATGHKERPQVWLWSGTQQIVDLPRDQGVYLHKIPGMKHQDKRMREREYSCNVGFAAITIVPYERGVDVEMSYWPHHDRAPSLLGLPGGDKGTRKAKRRKTA